MPYWSTMNLSKKLPILFASFSLIVALSLTFLSYNQFKKALLAETEGLFRAMTEERKFAVEAWITSIEEDAQIMAASPGIVDAIERFSRTWRNIKGDPTEFLQKAYIEDNPHPVGEKDQLVRAEGSGAYHFLHRTLHPYFRQVQQTKGYYDLFLFDVNGNLIYSVFKEDDFATNFLEGEFASSGLGRIVQRSLASENSQTHFADFEPYAPSQGNAASFLAVQVRSDAGDVIGALAFQMPQVDIVANDSSNEGLGKTGEILLVGEDRRARTGSRFSNGFQVYDQLPDSPQLDRAFSGDESFFRNVRGLTFDRVLTFSTTMHVNDLTWAIVAEKSMHEILAGAVHVRNLLVGILSLGCVVVCLAGWRVARSIVAPIERVREAMVAVSNGDYSVQVTDAGRGDEIGEIASVLMETKDKLAFAQEAEEERRLTMTAQTQAIQALRVGLTDLANGDFTNRILTDVHQDFAGLKIDFNKAVDSLNLAFGSVLKTTESIRTGAIEFSQSSEDLALRTETQASTLDDASSHLNNLTNSVVASAESAQSALEVVADARAFAIESGAVVEGAVSAMKRINDASERITSIISVIEDISFQTNLLALNAGVEAARAGSAGKGFAVVAAEVRALAHRCAAAANEIKDLIDNSSAEVRKGSELVDETGSALSSITERVDHLTKRVSGIADGAAQQSTSISDINANVGSLHEAIQYNAALVQEYNAASQMLKGDADVLSQLVDRFKIQAGEMEQNVSAS